ncbi:NAD(P)H-quinone oxidoreductase subunit 5 [Roseibium hamelinense]|uniref:Probable inorganic carbon transporter subunit DabB n=1 Tax=Roseibium hamelinense TaxID=150831 RepID=A0A562STP6_9HYPH|nr:proton-conducting transporter membrane subunit [Roseibium hamelinense]MTI43220.1 oxidoreductase [Roseibium hamelinense]TWI84729.1 NAD(P)H-quinone oxidoreductase subunit 5 [Roseibium hamelinense]
MVFSFLFLAPLVLLAAAGVAWRHPGRRPDGVPMIAEYSALAALFLAFLSVIQFVLGGPSKLSIFSGPAVLVLQANAVTVALGLLVAFIGWVVTRYSRTYLDGEAQEGRFHALMLATLAAVLLFVQSGSFVLLIVSSALVGLGLKRLLLFYSSRPEARRAATKFTLVWHGADAVLVLAAVLLFASFGTGDFSVITTAASEAGTTWVSSLAIALVVVGAILKTAAFPLHGWLTEVMEAPTPVSALLHAGIINSGGVLLIALSGLVQLSPGAMAALVMIGGLTAIFGAAVMLTQSAVKTSLAWSTVSQMGFLLLQCGLGLWALALLHIIAHSLYKAHAFLSSGGAVQAVAGLRRPGPIAVPSVAAVLKSFALALVLYAVIATLFTVVIGPKTAQALALGTILIFGVAYLVAQGLADLAPADLTKRTALASLGAAVAYFAFQALAHGIWGPSVPAAPVPGPLEWALIVLAVASFGLVAFAQALFPLWAHHPSTAGLRVHLANGFYLNALLDRAIGGFRIAKID